MTSRRPRRKAAAIREKIKGEVKIGELEGVESRVRAEFRQR